MRGKPEFLDLVWYLLEFTMWGWWSFTVIQDLTLLSLLIPLHLSPHSSLVLEAVTSVLVVPVLKGNTWPN